MSLNRVFLMGNLTRDPELRVTASNNTVAKFGLAVNRVWFDKAANEKREEVTFVDCEAWGKTAENIGKFFGKGKPILVEGRLKLDQWEDKQGGKRSRLMVVVESFEFVGGPKDGDAKPASTRREKPVYGGHEPVDEADIPF